MWRLLLTCALAASTGLATQGKTGQSNYQVPEGLVYGGAFIDRFRPVPFRGELRSDVWGATNVVPRDVNNGIEDPAYSYWGGNIIHGDDGREHMFVCRWPEDNVKGARSGHHTWWSSTVVHAVSDHPLGPYQVVAEIGPGHNPELYRLRDGSYVIGVMGDKAYRADTLDGPWTQIKTTFDWLDEDKPLNKTNRTYVPREDGSVLMMNKNGYVFISRGAVEHFRQVTARSVYPPVRGARFEDPVIWRDEVQYNAVVNDWFGRVAFHLRSADGIHWKWAPGIAYNPGIMRHEGGSPEEWFKFERPKVRQDRYGRATHMNFAVIDVPKDEDRAGDHHSSKNVVIPLTVPRRLVILNKEPITAGTREIRVKILGEEGFDPRRDVDLSSLTFGAPERVNFGRGCVPTGSEASGSDLIVTFTGKGNGITADNFAAKLIGRTREGELLFGYAKLPDEAADPQGRVQP